MPRHEPVTGVKCRGIGISEANVASGDNRNLRSGLRNRCLTPTIVAVVHSRPRRLVLVIGGQVRSSRDLGPRQLIVVIEEGDENKRLFLGRSRRRSNLPRVHSFGLYTGRALSLYRPEALFHSPSELPLLLELSERRRGPSPRTAGRK
jgi:hypothetical protein